MSVGPLSTFSVAEYRPSRLAIFTSGDIIGKHERSEINPYIEVAAKIADTLDVTLDYPVKDIAYHNIDNEVLNRLKLIESCSKKNVLTSSPPWTISSLNINCNRYCNKKPLATPAIKKIKTSKYSM